MQDVHTVSVKWGVPLSAALDPDTLRSLAHECATRDFSENDDVPAIAACRALRDVVVGRLYRLRTTVRASRGRTA